jgi:Tol biopolymer transport system component
MLRGKIKKAIFNILIVASLTSCSKSEKWPMMPYIEPDTALSEKPALKGMLVYHSYSCYACNDSRIYLYDFSKNTIKCLSQNWEIDNPMNAHFSPDGSKIVFMGTSKTTGNHDIYMYSFKTGLTPVNLTPGTTSRDEDPKFSTDGTRIVFKKNGRITIIDTLGTVLQSFNLPQKEAAMPYFSLDDQYILYSAIETEGSSTNDIYRLEIASGNSEKLTNLLFTEESHPIACSDSSYYYTQWESPSNQNDQLFMGFYNKMQSVDLKFNEHFSNYSDACPVSPDLLICSSTRNGGKGGSDLYLANIKTGDVWSLNQYNPNINTTANELGASFFSK